MTDADVSTHALRGPLRKRESHLWERSANDWYVEPAWCSARLFAEERFEGEVWDPACGGGTILDCANAYGLPTFASDIVARPQFNQPKYVLREDFLTMGRRGMNIVSNPPFGIAEKFVTHALTLAERKTAMLLPAKWIQSDKRARWLATTPLYRVWFICPRPSMPPGHVIADGKNPGNGTTDFAWFVWLRGYQGAPEVHWLHRERAAA